MILPQEPDLLIEKDIHGVIRELRHLQRPAVAEPGQSPKQAAFEYLRLAAGRGLLPLSDTDLEELDHTTRTDKPPRSGKGTFLWVEPRGLKRNGRIETTIVWCQQTVPAKVKNSEVVAIDVRGSSIRLVVHHPQGGDRLQITSARLTAARHVGLSADLERALGDIEPAWAEGLQPGLALELLGPILGLGSLDRSTVAITNAQLVAYHRRERTTAEGHELGVAFSAVAFMPVASGDSIAHQVLIDHTRRRILRKAPIASACAGYAFLSDPDSKTGNFRLRHDSGADALDHEHDPVALLDLKHVGGGRRELSGPRVRVLAPAALGKDYDPPVQRPPFAFTSRTNEFAAVSSYCHCDSMMRLVEGFGFDLKDHFKNVERPLTVEHRAKMLSGPGAHDGRGINAYVTPFLAGEGAPPWDVRMLFGLADFADTWKHPLGLAADVRFVWHEFCHVLIIAATGSTEFDFAHSAGDALGAIMSDPESKLPIHFRGVTFPFIQLPLRRHDRDVKQGWGWNGTLYEKPTPTYGLRDPAGYNAEQILSSTLFNLYCAAGGDAVRCNDEGKMVPDVERRGAAAYYIAYLIVRAIASLGSVGTEPTREPSQFATALMEAEIGTTDLDYEGLKRRGGMLHKVVRWAFEEQGLYQTSLASRHNGPGSPPPVDIYVDDGRHGKYTYCPHWHALPEALWVRHNADGMPGDQAPRAGQVNYVYVVLDNRGDQPAAHTSVDVFAAVGDDVDTWNAAPGHWQQLAGPNAPANVPAGHKVMFGPFRWTPEAGKRNALLVRATALGDRSNIDADSNLPCAAGPAPLADLVRADNNLGYRYWPPQ
jgi:hypothetical protein